MHFVKLAVCTLALALSACEPGPFQFVEGVTGSATFAPDGELSYEINNGSHREICAPALTVTSQSAVQFADIAFVWLTDEVSGERLSGPMMASLEGRPTLPDGELVASIAPGESERFTVALHRPPEVTDVASVHWSIDVAVISCSSLPRRGGDRFRNHAARPRYLFSMAGEGSGPQTIALTNQIRQNLVVSE